MRSTRIHRRADDAASNEIRDYISMMDDEELYVYVKEVFMMDPDDDWVGHDAEIAVNCAMTMYGRANDVDRSRQDQAQMALGYRDLMTVLEKHQIATREDIECE